MRSTFTSSILTLLLALLAVPCMTTSTVSAQCPGCIDDVVHSVPSCDGLDNSVTEPHFSDYTPKEQQCLCNLGLNPSIVLKCQGLCPNDDFGPVMQVYNATYQIYCAGTAMANGGPVSNGSKSAAAGSFSSVSMAFAGLVAVTMSVALALAA